MIEHLESFLGLITGGSRGDDATPEGVQVAWFGPDVPFGGVTTLVTVGLSRRHLGLPNGGALHQELVMHVPTDDYPARAAGLLFQVAGEMVRREAGLQHGQVIGPRGPLFPDSQTTAMVAISPRYMPESFAVCHTESAPVVLTWLVPITTGEAEVIQKSGWGTLEQAFAAQNPDLADPGRAEVALDQLTW
ncbi:suppressor of fused protein SUFU [Micromonospora kangleipakensis]|uniref:Suppressor of fused protein SUFU n=1 Tax=Micromonospora kangleipakensis TaxID=1077942 RepID=A0A4Q8BC59_9ACTN|nr:suppressor of fused protein SUFU [Micromonospora kangleipakensis]